MKRIISIGFLVFTISTLGAVEKVNFLSKPLTAGKASLTENSFFLPQFLGTANFSPDFRFPIQLIYVRRDMQSERHLLSQMARRRSASFEFHSGRAD